jgi:hypothetical protein
MKYIVVILLLSTNGVGIQKVIENGKERKENYTENKRF